MKSTLIILLLILLFSTGKAQTYLPGATDTSGDKTQPLSPDVKAIYHAWDMNDDSLWFRMEFYSRIDNVTWNVKVGIDTNNNVTDGGIWAGQNTSMNFDLLADVYSNPGFPPPYGNVLSGSGAYISGNISISIPDTNILIVGLRLSEIQQAGIPLHYIAGAGIVVGLVNDDIPDANYISISGLAGIAEYFNEDEILIYPNPAKEELRFSLKNNLPGLHLQYCITDVQGKILKTGILNPPSYSVSVSSFADQEYFISVFDGKINYVHQFIKQ